MSARQKTDCEISLWQEWWTTLNVVEYCKICQVIVNFLSRARPATLAVRVAVSGRIISNYLAMTSRRIVSMEKNLLEKDDSDGRTPSASEKSNIVPAVPA